MPRKRKAGAEGRDDNRTRLVGAGRSWESHSERALQQERTISALSLRPGWQDTPTWLNPNHPQAGTVASLPPALAHPTALLPPPGAELELVYALWPAVGTRR